MLRRWLAPGSEPQGFWATILFNIFYHISFIDLWFETFQGKLVLRSLLFPASMTVLFLFAGVQPIGYGNRFEIEPGSVFVLNPLR